ncbi:MAG TPA: hypothetical protein VGD74_05390 [Vulgatibacter sp.]
MKRITLLAAALSSVVLVGCGDSEKENTVVIVEPAKEKRDHARDQVYWFSGHIYDGMTSARLTSYTLDLQYKDTTLTANVGEDGRYVVGPLPYFQDYTVRIRAEGYRSFLSHNAGIEFEWPTEEAQVDRFAPEKGFYYNAYLFPADVQAPGATVWVNLDGSDAKPTAGTVRFTPDSSSNLTEPYPAVNGQIWANSDDMQLGSFSKPIVDGVASVQAGELTYGVTDLVTVFGVPGYAPVVSSILGGFEDGLSLTLDEIASDDLELVYDTTQSGMPASNGEVTLVFNRPIEFAPPRTVAQYQGIVDANLSIFSPDDNGNFETNTLKTPDDGRGTKVEIRSNLLILRWDQSKALETVDAADPILSVTYGGLFQVDIRPAGETHPSYRTSVGSELGSDSITVDLR